MSQFIDIITELTSDVDVVTLSLDPKYVISIAIYASGKNIVPWINNITFNFGDIAIINLHQDWLDLMINFFQHNRSSIEVISYYNPECKTDHPLDDRYTNRLLLNSQINNRSMVINKKLGSALFVRVRYSR